MKHQHCRKAGNALMIVGMIVMITGIGFSVINQLPSITLPSLMAQGAILGIFIGALLWLAGARISGREKIEDRYYWHRHYDERCRKTPHH
ncbi:stress-induced protein YchH [Pantoea sp. KPR_PJ]|uniref:stress-induced protein YchH n=1 Tax=Pantoea sp. KPR_PJ TaxID=2738375 RepID=UPI003529A05A